MGNISMLDRQTLEEHMRRPGDREGADREGGGTSPRLYEHAQ